MTLDVHAALTTYEDDDSLRIYVQNGSGEEIELLNLQGAPLSEFSGTGYHELSAAIPDAWREARLVIESSTNSSQDAERIDFDNVAFRSPNPASALEVISY